jgi:hypothetical protein
MIGGYLGVPSPQAITGWPASFHPSIWRIGRDPAKLYPKTQLKTSICHLKRG